MKTRAVKAIILAAGKGSRLKSSRPKALTLLANGNSILELQVNLLLKYPRIDDIIVVVGYQKEKIIKQFPHLTYVYNLQYEKTNTANSLLRALKKCLSFMSEDATPFDILWLNGDVIFQTSVLEKVFTFLKTCMVVNSGKVGEEEVKYCLDPEGRINQVSKHVQNPQGEALGINYFTAKDLPALVKGLEQCSDMDYFERGIEYCIEAGTEVFSVQVAKDTCIEIDFPEDLERANQIKGQ